jgi:uncharacterized membrane protein
MRPVDLDAGASRLEGFSDAVFGFAVTLLVVSLEVPSTFDDLMAAFRGLPVFAITFAILLLVWQEHHRFFRKFAASDGATIWLNGALLFTVMVYIYPLKFLFALLAGPKGFLAGEHQRMIRIDQLVDAMVLYGVGFLAMFAMLGALYVNAWRRCRTARLPAREAEALAGLGHCLIYVVVATISIVVALVGGRQATIASGLCYMLIAPGHVILHKIASRRPA